MPGVDVINIKNEAIIKDTKTSVFGDGTFVHVTSSLMGTGVCFIDGDTTVNLRGKALVKSRRQAWKSKFVSVQLDIALLNNMTLVITVAATK